MERLTALEAAACRSARLARRLLREFDLPDPEAAEPWAKSDRQPAVLESLLAAADEPAMRALVEERARLVRTLAGSDARRTGRPGRSRAISTCVYAAGAAGRQEFRGSDYVREGQDQGLETEDCVDHVREAARPAVL